MAETKKEETKKKVETPEEKFARLQAEAEELVTIKLFKDSNRYKDDVTVGINGTVWQIKRGIEVQVPRKVAEVLEESSDADFRAIEYMDGLQKESSI